MKEKAYRFILHKDRNIDVIFHHMPQKRISTGTKDIDEAVKFAEEYLTHIGKAQGTPPLFKVFSEDFFVREDSNSQRARDKKFNKKRDEAYYEKHQRNLNLYINPYFGNYRVDSISSVIIEDWIVGLKGKKKKDLSPQYRNVILSTLDIVFQEIERQGWVKENPLGKAQYFSVSAEDIVRVRNPLTLYEQNILFPPSVGERIEVWETLMWATLFSVMYDTGFRPGEVLGLRVCDIYKTPRGYAVYTEQTFNTGEGKIKQRVKTSGKGMESRVGLLSEVTGKMIVKLAEECKTDTEALFLQYRRKKNSYIKSTTSNYQFVKIMKKYGFDEITTQYCLRHTYATYRRGDMDDNALALAMGHKNGVLQDYDHRKATILIKQLEENRDEIFKPMDDNKEEEIVPLKKRG